MANAYLSAVVQPVDTGISLTAGAGTTTNDGGAVAVTSGAGGEPYGNGGSLTVGTGNGGQDGNGGALVLTTGTGGTPTGAGGNINATAGNGGAEGNGGSVNITAGNGGATSGNGGNITLTPGGMTSGAIGHLILVNIPTADPTVAGALWNDAGTLKISAG